MPIRIQTGDTEPLYYNLLNQIGEPLTGASNLFVRVSRVSDDYILDWDDFTFKASGWVSPAIAVTEVDATNQPGLYKVVGGLPTGSITNPVADDVLLVTMYQDPSANYLTPVVTQISVGQWADQIDDILTDTNEIQGKLPTNNIMGSAVKTDKDDEIDSIIADIAALNNLSQTDVQTALNNHGYTSARALNLDNLDVAVSSRESETDAATRAAEHGVTQAAIAALNDLSQADVQSAMDSQGYTSARAPQLDNLDTPVSTRSSHTPADVDTQLTGTHGAGSWAAANPADVADAVWDEALAGHVAAGSAGEAQNHLDADISTRATQADILSDATPFAGANIDAAISSRAAPGDAMDLVANSVDNTSLALSAVNEIRDGILSDSTPFAGANIDAAVSSRSSHTPADVDTQLSGAHGAGSWEGETAADIADAVWDEPIAGHTAVGSTGEALDTAATGADPLAVADAVWDEALAGHTAAGSAGKSLSDTETSAAAIDARLPTDPADESNQLAQHSATQAAISALNDIDQADVQAAMTAQGYTAARAPNLDNLDAAVSSRSDHDPTDVDVTLTGSHGSGSWQQGGSALTQQQVRDAMKLAPTFGAPDAGSVDEHLDDILADTAAIEPVVTANLDATISSVNAGISALNDIDIADVQTALTNQGYTVARSAFLDNLDDTVSNVLAAIAALNDITIPDVQTALTNNGYNPARAALLDNLTNLDAAISSVITAISALNDLSQSDVQAALDAQGYTSLRAGLLDYLDSTISSVLTAIAALNDITVNDIWSEIVPGAYPVGSAAQRLGDAGEDRAHMSATYDDVGTEIDIGVWLTRSGTVVTAGLIQATITWRNPDGTQLFQVVDSSPDAQGVFRVQQTQTLVDNEPYYVEVAIEDALGTVASTIGVPFQA